MLRIDQNGFVWKVDCNPPAKLPLRITPGGALEFKEKDGRKAYERGGDKVLVELDEFFVLIERMPPPPPPDKDAPPPVTGNGAERKRKTQESGGK